MLYKNSLEEEAKFILEEVRVVVPGIQALFGFQLIAVFNAGFDEKLSFALQVLHLFAIFFVILAMILVMAPSALHRLAERGMITSQFNKISSRLLTNAMAALRVGICLDFYIVTEAVLKNRVWSLGITIFIFLICYGMWSAYPRLLGRWVKQDNHLAS